MKKNLLYPLLVGIAVWVCITPNTPAANHTTQSLLVPGEVALVVTNPAVGPGTNQANIKSTNSFSATNLTQLFYGNNTPSTYGNNQTIWAYATNSVSPSTVIGGVSGSNVIALGPLIQSVNQQIFNFLGTNSFYYVYTNGYSNSAGNINPGPFYDASGFADANGCPTTNLNFCIAINGDNTSFTNTVVFDFIRRSSSVLRNYYPQLPVGGIWDSNNVFSVTLTGNGTNLVVANTNPPVWFVEGSAAYRVKDIVLGTNSAGTNVYVQEISLGGFIP